MDDPGKAMSEPGQMGVTFLSGKDPLVGTLFLARGSRPKATFLLLYGIPGIEKNYDLAQALRGQGYNALIFHYRGSWGSAGMYCLETIPEDVVAAVDHIARGRYARIDRTKLAVIGHSLGGWAALLATATDERLGAVAVYGTVGDPSRIRWTLEDIAAEFTPWLAGITPAGFSSQWAALNDRLNPALQIHCLAPRPLLILHARQDMVIPIQHAEELSRRAGYPHTFEVHHEADHSFTWHRPWLVSRLAQWAHSLGWQEPSNR